MKNNIFLINSPNFNKNIRKRKQINFLIYHYTGMQSVVETINRLCDIKSKVSCHYLIDENGKIIQLVQDNYIAWHAGKSGWKKFKSINKFSIGIELVNPGHKFGYKNFTNKQITALTILSKKLIKKYKIKKQNILGHSDIAPLRKKDPGEKFPWKFLTKKKIGIWHTLNNRILTSNRKKNTSIKEKFFFLKTIKYIGYQMKPNIGIVNKNRTIQAFQRRFRPELINGIIDRECLLVAKNIGFIIKKNS